VRFRLGQVRVPFKIIHLDDDTLRRLAYSVERGYEVTTKGKTMSNQSVYKRRAEVPAKFPNSNGLVPAVRLTLLLAALALFSVCASAESWKLKAQADLAYRRGDFKTAFQKYMKLAKEKGGSAYAECQLGIMLERAEGTPQDITQAVTWYRLG